MNFVMLVKNLLKLCIYICKPQFFRHCLRVMFERFVYATLILKDCVKQTYEVKKT